MDLASKSFDLRLSCGGRIAMAREHNHVSLANGLARPCQGFAAAEVNHQRRGVFEFVEPICDFGCIQRAPGKHSVDAGGIDDLGISRTEPIAHSAIKSVRYRLPYPGHPRP